MGRPRMYETEEELDEAIEKYFRCLKVADGSLITPTMSGLAIDLGFSSRQSLNDYEKDERFSYLIKRARLRIENIWEQMLTKQSCTGAIFWLKNHAGYTDKQEISGPNNGPIEIMSIDARRSRVAELIAKAKNGTE